MKIKTRINKQNIIDIIIVVMGMVAVLFVLTHVQVKEQEVLSQEVLRFHVLANSDSKKDQELKRKVRDAVGNYMSEKLADASSLEESEEIVSNHLSDIEEVAHKVIAENGYDYAVTATIETTEFPQKEYGDYTFPAGQYRALRVVIGDGEGANWWCVLYPNMCFSDSVYEVVEEGAKTRLKEVLTVAQYKELIESKDKKIEFKVLSGIE